MSLLDDRRDSIVLIPEIPGTDDMGDSAMIPDPDQLHWVTLYGRFQDASSTEPPVDGQKVRTTSVFITRSFPAGAWSHVLKDGIEWDVDGEPVRSNGSDFTRHFTVSLQARSPRPVVTS